MKSIVKLAALLLVLLMLTACGSSPNIGSDSMPTGLSGVGNGEGGAQAVMVAYSEDMDSTVGRAVWAAMQFFEGETGVPCAQYRATPEDMQPTLELAVHGGAKLVVFVGTTMADTMQEAQQKYPDIEFVLVDAPIGMHTQANGATVVFASEQAGWLAGYAAVADGATKLAYFYGEDITLQLHALGFVLGAQAAAEELGVYVEARPVNTGENAWPVWDVRMRQVLDAGTQVVLVSEVDLVSDAMAEANKAEAKIVAPETDAVTLPNNAVLTMMRQSAQQPLYDLLLQWKAGAFPAGQTLFAGVANGGVALDVGNAQFEEFSQMEYDSTVARWTDGALEKELAERLAPNEQGSYPLPENLGLSHVRVVLPQANPSPNSQSLPESSSGVEPEAPPESE